MKIARAGLSCRLVLLTSGAVAAISSAQARAQQSAVLPNAQAEAARTPNASSGTDIVVTGLKLAGQTDLNTPAAVSVLSGEQIASYNASSLQDFLGQTPGIAIGNGQAGGQAIGIRGFSPNFGPAAVGFYMDDLPFSFINANLVPDLTPVDLASIEILRGPQSTLYGAGSSAGVVKIRTQDPDLRNAGGEVEGYGMATKDGAGSYSASGIINLPIVADRLAFRGVLAYQDLGGWIEDAYSEADDSPDYGKDVNDSQRFVARGKLLYKATDRLTLTGLANHTRLKTGMVSLSDDARLFPKAFTTGGNERFNQFGVKAQYDTDGVSIVNTLGYIDLFRTYTYPDWQQFAQRLTAKTLSNELTASSLGSGPLKWVIGLFYRHTRQTFVVDFSTVGLPYNVHDSAFADELSAYGNLTYSLVPDRLELGVGASYTLDRTDQNSPYVLNAAGEAYVAQGVPASALLPATTIGREVRSDIFSPKISLTYHPGDNSTVYAVYSQGFRPGFNDFGYSTSFGKQAILAAGGNADAVTGALQPERVKAYEIGLKASLIGRLLYFDIALFQNDITNSQQSAMIVDPSSGLQTNAAVNIGSARTRGVEASLILRNPIPGLDVTFNTSYVDAKVAENSYVGGVLIFHKGDPLNGVPKWSYGVTANAHQNLDGGGLRLTEMLRAQYTSPRYASALGIQPYSGDAITRVDARIELEKQSVAFYVFAQNLLDDNGRINPSPLSSEGYAQSVTNRGIPIDGLLGTRLRPRTLGVGARLSF